MPAKQLIYTILALFGGQVLGFGQSETLQRLKDSDQVGHQFFFYPSTLRMLNLQGDKAYNAMVKDIDKLVFYQLRHDGFSPSDWAKTVESIQGGDRFEEYLVVEAKDQELRMLGKGDETVFLAHYDDTYYVAEVSGSIDVTQLPAVYETLSQRDTTLESGFLNIFELMGSRGLDHRERRPKEKEEAKPVDKTKRS